MAYYVLLTISTTLIIVLAAWIWLRTRSISFPLGIALIYYLSLYGAWSIVVDKLGGDSGKHYDYLELKMFSVALDDNYFYSLILYSAFILVLEFVVLRMVWRLGLQRRPVGQPLLISHRTILLISFVTLAVSYLIVRQGLIAAEDSNKSAYELMHRGLGEVSSYFTIHQILLRVSSVTAALGAVVQFCGKKARFIRGDGGAWTTLGYVLAIGMTAWLSFVSGYKSELFFPGVAGCLFYLVNAERPRIVRLGFVGFAILAGMSLVDLLRYIPLSELVGSLIALRVNDIIGVFQFAASSNEAFAPHFSMYGALSHNIPLTYGSSFLSLAASVIPRMVWPNRPDDIYVYYAQKVSSIPDQGYTIHHATGWYLNFGVLGVFMGAALMGWVWGKCYRSYLDASTGSGSGWMRILKILSPWLFVAGIPFVMHAGPEIYKGLLVEVLLLPSLSLRLAARHNYAPAANVLKHRPFKNQLELKTST